MFGRHRSAGRLADGGDGWGRGEIGRSRRGEERRDEMRGEGEVGGVVRVGRGLLKLTIGNSWSNTTISSKICSAATALR